MKSLKLSKKKKTEMSEHVEMDAPEYPWGTEINLEEEQVSKFKELEGVSVDDELTALVKLSVRRVESSETKDSGKQHRMALQITDMEFVPAEQKAPDASKLYGKDG